MDINLTETLANVYHKCGLVISELKFEHESEVYEACRFKLNGFNIIGRTAKITPKKVGQFVTFWKRNDNGPIEPFHETDSIDFFTIIVCAENQVGQFVFPKSVLIKKGVISTDKKEGKRAFRVYPPWDIAKNNQAIRTQKWQLQYFCQIAPSADYKKIEKLYSPNS